MISSNLRSRISTLRKSTRKLPRLADADPKDANADEAVVEDRPKKGQNETSRQELVVRAGHLRRPMVTMKIVLHAAGDAVEAADADGTIRIEIGTIKSLPSRMILTCNRQMTSTIPTTTVTTDSRQAFSKTNSTHAT